MLLKSAWVIRGGIKTEWEHMYVRPQNPAIETYLIEVVDEVRGGQ